MYRMKKKLNWIKQREQKRRQDRKLIKRSNEIKNDSSSEDDDAEFVLKWFVKLLADDVLSIKQGTTF